MTRVLKGLCFAGPGGVMACILTFVVVLSYSFEPPIGASIIVAVSVGALLGFVAGAIWGSVAIKWLLEALMNF